MREDLQVRSPYGELVGTTVLSADVDARTIEVGYEAGHGFTNRIGTIAGGMLSSMLDSVTGLAALPEELVAVQRKPLVALSGARGRVLGRSPGLRWRSRRGRGLRR